MKIAGLIGGSSWHSTIEYYRHINTLVNQKLGGHHSAKMLIYSINLEEMVSFANKNQWNEVLNMFVAASQRLEKGGAECIGLCANTMHKIADELEKHLSIPLIHIADVVKEECIKNQITKVALLGTEFTMKSDFYPQRLQPDVQIFIPEPADRQFMQSAIVNEITHGIFKSETKQRILCIIQKLVDVGIEGVVMGCTELPMFIKKEDIKGLQYLDTTFLHSKKIADFCLENVV